MFARPIHAGAETFALLMGASVILFTCSTTGCAKKNSAHVPTPARIGSTETGIASWYGIPYHGRRSANGEIYDMNLLTAAHRTLPFDTWVEVTNLSNSKRVDVRITDRGPFVKGRIIDLSLAAANEIDMVTSGIAQVKLKVIRPPKNIPPPQKNVALSPPTAEPTPHTPARIEPAVGETALEIPAPPIAAPHVDAPHVEVPGNMASTDLFAVQAGAFSSRDRAEALWHSLESEFQDIRIVESPPLWRVVIGSKLSQEEALKLAAKVRLSVGESLVIKDKQPADKQAPTIKDK